MIFSDHLEQIQNKSPLFKNKSIHVLNANCDIAQFLSGEQLFQASKKVADYLVSHNLSGQRVAVCFPSSIEFLVAMVGCFIAKSIAVPLNIPMSEKDERFIEIFRSAEPAAIIVHQSTRFLLDKLPNGLASEQINCHDGLSIIAMPLSQRPKVYQNDSNLAFIQYTSGSTAEPKGVCITHDNLHYNLNYIYKLLALSPEEKCLSWLPNFHDMGLVGNLLLSLSLYFQFPLYILPTQHFMTSPLNWLKAIDQYQISFSGAPNFAYDLSIKAFQQSPEHHLNLSFWTCAFNSAEPIKSETIEQFTKTFEPHGFKKSYFYTGYGLAEATLVVSGIKRDETPNVIHADKVLLSKNQIHKQEHAHDDTQSLVSAGRVIDQTEVVIINAENKQLPVNHVGEILISGPTIAKSYWNNSRATEKAFVNLQFDNASERLYLKTGDLGFLNENQELFITGRVKDMLIIHGENHYPQDIESTVSDVHRSFRAHNIAAFQLEERPYIILMIGTKNIEQEDIQVLAQKIADKVYTMHGLSVEKITLVTGSLPKTTSGKIRRKACRERILTPSPTCYIWENPYLATSHDKHELENHQILHFDNHENVTRTSIEKRLLQLVSHQIGQSLSTDGLDAPYSQFGLDSIQVVDIFKQIESWLNLDLSPTLFFQHQNLSELAEYLFEQYQLEENAHA